MLDIVVVSGGAESVGASIVSWVNMRGFPARVFSLNSDSLLHGMSGVQSIKTTPEKESRQITLERLIEYIDSIYREKHEKVIAYPTEDDSLGLLLDVRKQIPHALSMSHCRALESGGLDKGELFSVLASKGVSKYLTPTISLHSWDDVKTASDQWQDMIVKPAFKPWSRNLQGGVKLFLKEELSTEIARKEMETSWEQGIPWVAQPRLSISKAHERSACLVRGKKGIRYAEVVELSKYPGKGGSACWVQTQSDQESKVLLRNCAQEIAEAVDLVGMAEISFLFNADGEPQLLELNARPWLQMELLLHAGFDLINDSITAFSEQPLEDGIVKIQKRDWLSLERMLLKIVNGDGPRLKTARNLMSALSARPYISIWSNPAPGLRRRWMKKMAKKLFN